MTLIARLSKELSQRPASATVTELATALGDDETAISDVLWAHPEHFMWQPGNRWAAQAGRPALDEQHVPAEHRDTREGLITQAAPVELHAVTMSSGLTLRVLRRAMDSSAFFTVRSSGSEVQLILNSAHPLFSAYPMPFTGPDPRNSLVAVLLEAWALHENALPVGPAKRALEELRHAWGRQALELYDAENHAVR